MISFCRPKQRGLTLIEVLAAIAMLAILTVLLTPDLSNYFHQANIKGATEAFYNDINLARTSAIQSTTAVSVTVISGPNWCYGLYSTGSCACNSAPSTSNCNLGVTTSANYKNTSLSASSADITFSSSRGTTTTTTVTFSGGGKSATININEMGMPSICSAGGTVGGYPVC